MSQRRPSVSPLQSSLIALSVLPPSALRQLAQDEPDRMAILLAHLAEAGLCRPLQGFLA